MISTMADLVIGSRPSRTFQLRSLNAAVNITVYTVQGQLQSTTDGAPVLGPITGVLSDAPAGKVRFDFPELTASNTGGRDDGRIWRILVWTGTFAGVPNEIFEFNVRVR